MYDSRDDTMAHIHRVQELLFECERIIDKAAVEHDASKLREPEKSVFDEFTPKLKDSRYGSDAYKQFLQEMKPALDHHYVNNTHHPEHFEHGIDDMDLFQVLEMLMDWKAATERHNDGSITRSLTINQTRFKIDEQLANILWNTIKTMGWEE